MMVTFLNAWQIFLKGGPLMWPILMLSIFAVGIAINRMIYLSKIERRLKKDKIELIESLHLGRLKDTMRLCESQSGGLGRMLKAGIVHFGSSRDLIKGAMEEPH